MNSPRPTRRPTFNKPPLRLFTTTLWEYPSQHYDAFLLDGKVIQSKHKTQGRADYTGATPSWIIWQLLVRYTRQDDTVLDPFCGSGTTIDVASDLDRKALGFDIHPSRHDITFADARKLPLPPNSADFVFIDPPYSTHVDYGDHPDDIGKLTTGGEDQGQAYYQAMGQTIDEIHRVLRDRRYMALYVSDSFRKKRGEPGGTFMPIGVELFAYLCQLFRPIDIIAVARKNQKLDRGNWHKAAEEGNFFMRGFNYLFIMKKEDAPSSPSRQSPRKPPANPTQSAPHQPRSPRPHPPRRGTGL